jgi:hypothetical protein
MADNVNLVDAILDTIRKNIKPHYINKAKTEVSIRCPYCGDSRKDPRSAHLYINLEEPFWFYCQRCNTSGRMSPNFLKDVKVFDSNLSLGLYEVGKKYKYNSKKKKSHAMFAEKTLEIPEPTGTTSELAKLKYFNDRLGTDISLHEASQKFKMILNFGKFCIHNEIDEFTENLEMIKKLNKYAVGFLSYDQSNIIFRSIVDKKESGFRYHNYNIFGDYENTKRFYTIGAKIDILKPKLHVVATEGIMDILGTYCHFFRGKELDNYLFVAINGKGYHLVFQHLARLGFLDIDLQIFSDSDVDRDFYKYIKEGSPVLKNTRIKLNYNKLKKDFGVKKEEINHTYTIV